MAEKYDLEMIRVNDAMANALLDSGWKFNWALDRDKSSDPDIEYIKIGAYIKNELEGLVKFTRRPEELFNFVHLIELAPYNVGEKKMHEGVAGSLFASVAKDSLEQGFEGFIVFESKEALYNHYILKYGAKPTLGKLLMFDTAASNQLIEKYLGGRDAG